MFCEVDWGRFAELNVISLCDLSSLNVDGHRWGSLPPAELVEVSMLSFIESDIASVAALSSVLLRLEL